MPEMDFNSLDMLQLSEFYVASVTIEDCTLERVIMIPTSGIPEDGMRRSLRMLSRREISL